MRGFSHILAVGVAVAVAVGVAVGVGVVAVGTLGNTGVLRCALG
jgi:hypothetical protein